MIKAMPLQVLALINQLVRYMVNTEIAVDVVRSQLCDFELCCVSQDSMGPSRGLRFSI